MNQEEEALTMDRYVRHYVFTWNVKGLAFWNEEENEVMVSPTFEMESPDPMKWKLDLYPNEKLNERTGLSCYLQYEGPNDENIESTTVYFKFQCKNDKNDTWCRSVEDHSNYWSGYRYGVRCVMEFEKFLEDIERESPVHDLLILTCETYLFVTPKNSLRRESQTTSKAYNDECNLSLDMKNLYETKRQADLEIRLKNGKCVAHKAILCARSNVFSTMLKWKNKTFLQFPNVEQETMNKLLEFVYTGKFEELTMADYSPFQMYEYAKQFEISDIIRVFSPQKYFASTSIITKECGLTWPIVNYRQYKASTELPGSPIFKSFPPVFSEWNLRLCFEEKESVSVFVDRLDDDGTALRGLLTISVLDNKGEKSHTKRKWVSSKDKETFEFHSFIKKKDISPYLMRGVLTIDCTLRYSTGEISSNLDSKTGVFGVDWGNFGFLSSDFEMLLQNGNFSDMVLVAGQRKFAVHRFMLMARSPVFDSMFQHDMLEKKTGEVIIDDVEPDVIEILLYYIYSGKLDESLLSQKALLIYFASDKYAIELLNVRCSEFLESNLRDESACEVLIAADLHADTELKKAAEVYICKNAGSVLLRKEWQDVVTHHPKLASDILNCLANAFCLTAECDLID